MKVIVALITIIVTHIIIGSKWGMTHPLKKHAYLILQAFRKGKERQMEMTQETIAVMILVIYNSNDYLCMEYLKNETIFRRT